MIFDDFKMIRKDKRFGSMNLTTVEIYDIKRNGIYQGMGKTLNLSVGGMLLEIYDQIPVQLNYGITLQVGLFGSNIVLVKGIVKWLHYYEGNIRIGIQFLPLTKKISDKITNFLEKME
jgi:hypothetical protein